MNIRWTAEADKSFNGIVDYLLEIWNLEIATNFVDRVGHTIKSIIQNPKMFKVSPYVICDLKIND